MTELQRKTVDHLLSKLEMSDGILLEWLLNEFERRALEGNIYSGRLEFELEQAKATCQEMLDERFAANDRRAEILARDLINSQNPNAACLQSLDAEPNDLDLIEDELAVRPEAFHVTALAPVETPEPVTLPDAWRQILGDDAESNTHQIKNDEIPDAREPETVTAVKEPSNDRQAKPEPIKTQLVRGPRARNRDLTPQEQAQVVRYAGERLSRTVDSLDCARTLRVPRASVSKYLVRLGDYIGQFRKAATPVERNEIIQRVITDQSKKVTA